MFVIFTVHYNNNNIIETRLKKSREEEKMMVMMIVNDINDNVKRGSAMKINNDDKECHC